MCTCTIVVFFSPCGSVSIPHKIILISLLSWKRDILYEHYFANFGNMKMKTNNGSNSLVFKCRNV